MIYLCNVFWAIIVSEMRPRVWIKSIRQRCSGPEPLGYLKKDWTDDILILQFYHFTVHFVTHCIKTVMSISIKTVLRFETSWLQNVENDRMKFPPVTRRTSGDGWSTAAESTWSLVRPDRLSGKALQMASWTTNTSNRLWRWIITMKSKFNCFVTPFF